MHFIVVGIDFKTAEVGIREKFHFSNESLPDALSMLNSYSSIKGSVILSTCNRVEIYASSDNVENGFADIIDFISRFHKIPAEQFLPFIVKKNCQTAVTHLFRVISSLESMIIGEYQIQGQVRNAYFIANENKASNNMLNKIFQTAIQVGKRVRTETKIGEGTVSVATLALELVKQIFQQRNKCNVLIIGAGKISSLTALNFQKNFSNCKITVSNRSIENALEFAEKFNGNVIDFDKRYEAIKENDIIIASTNSDDYIIEEHKLFEKLKSSAEKTRIFIDLSIPRNIDPNIDKIENCRVYSIDDINKLIVSNIDKRATEILLVEKIIKEISEDYYDWYSKQFIIPTMIEIKKELEIIKQKTLSSYKTQLDSIDKKQKEIISEMLDSYSDKLIKVIMRNIKNSTTKEDLISITNTLRETFSIEINEN